MTNLERKNLTPDQIQAIQDWWNQNDPDQARYDNVDNERYAIQGNPDHENHYYNLQHNGCCGFTDVELPLPNGQTLLYGFNYGH